MRTVGDGEVVDGGGVSGCRNGNCRKEKKGGKGEAHEGPFGTCRRRCRRWVTERSEVTIEPRVALPSYNCVVTMTYSPRRKPGFRLIRDGIRKALEV